jgi:hypothetical protein
MWTFYVAMLGAPIQFDTQAFAKLTNAFPGCSGRIGNNRPVSNAAPHLRGC